MYESFFRFTSRPFVAAPLVANYFASEAAETARQTLTRSIDRAEGPGLIVGPAGVGKTLLCRMLAARFQETFQVAMLSSTRILTRKALLQNILFELGLPYSGMEEGELRLSLLDHLQPNDECPNGILLIVDEAHSLPLRLLEEIRMITNLVRDGQPRVRLVMAGSSKLEEKFASPKLESFNQRIAARCYLEPFGRDDTIDYVLSRIAVAGGNADSVFDEGALRAIYQATDGIPRLVNQVCDHSLVMAFAGGRQQIDAAGIEEAWADLQQLPGPWHDTPEADISGATIEFGELETKSTEQDVNVETFDQTPAVLSLEVEPAFGFTPEMPIVEAPSGDLNETTPEAETLVSVADPFGDGFDEEEVVIDQAVIQSADIFANRPRVTSDEGRELVASMVDVQKENVVEEPTPEAEELTIEPATETTVEIERVAETPHTVAEPITSADQDQQTSDDLQPQSLAAAEMFEYTAFEPNAAADLALEALCDVNVALGDLEGEYEAPSEPAEPTVKMVDHQEPAASEGDVDDRAIILVENDEPAQSSEIPEGSVHRVEYQALFSQLRHG